jgi:hypothetical protein
VPCSRTASVGLSNRQSSRSLHLRPRLPLEEGLPPYIWYVRGRPWDVLLRLARHRLRGRRLARVLGDDATALRLGRRLLKSSQICGEDGSRFTTGGVMLTQKGFESQKPLGVADTLRRFVAGRDDYGLFKGYIVITSRRPRCLVFPIERVYGNRPSVTRPSDASGSPGLIETVRLVACRRSAGKPCPGDSFRSPKLAASIACREIKPIALQSVCVLEDGQIGSSGESRKLRIIAT